MKNLSLRTPTKSLWNVERLLLTSTHLLQDRQYSNIVPTTHVYCLSTRTHFRKKQRNGIRRFKQSRQHTLTHMSTTCQNKCQLQLPMPPRNYFGTSKSETLKKKQFFYKANNLGKDRKRVLGGHGNEVSG